MKLVLYPKEQFIAVWVFQNECGYYWMMIFLQLVM